MKMLSKAVMIVTSVAVPLMLCGAGANQSKPSSAIYLMTNDDGLLQSYVSFYLAGGTEGAPTLTFQNAVNTSGLGIGGGFFGSPRVTLLPDPSAQCVYASDAGSGDIAAIDIARQQLVGAVSGSFDDSAVSNGIGLVMNQNYLYAGYSLSNTIATFAVGAGCRLSFLADITVTPLNGGWVAGMALNGNTLVVTYADGSIESFNTANGIPMSNDDEQNAAGFADAFFPDSVDLTQDGHFAIFGDASVATTVEVSDLSSGKLAPTAQYTMGVATNAVGPGANSATARLSPDESLLYIGNSQSGNVTAAFFDKNTGKVTPGCASRQLNSFYNGWSYIGGLATRDNTGTGNVLYAAEFGFSIAIINVTSTGTTCTLTESSASPVPDYLSGGLLSIQTFPPRPF